MEDTFRRARMTVFAPDDAAFFHLTAGTVDRLLRPENHEQLVAYVNYCWVPSHKYLTDPQGHANAEALPGDEITVRVPPGAGCRSTGRSAS